MKLSEITDQEHFKKMLSDPKTAAVEKRLEELVPAFKRRGWALTWENIGETGYENGPSIIVEFNILDSHPGKNPDPDSNRHQMNKLFPDIFQSSVIRRHESRMTIQMWPHHETEDINQHVVQGPLTDISSKGH